MPVNKQLYKSTVPMRNDATTIYTKDRIDSIKFKDKIQYENESKKFISDWNNRRKNQLLENIQNKETGYYGNLYKYIKSKINPDVVVNKELNRLNSNLNSTTNYDLNNEHDLKLYTQTVGTQKAHGYNYFGLNNTPEDIINYELNTTKGSFTPGLNSLQVNRGGKSTLIHEQSHSTRPIYQEHKIKDIVKDENIKDYYYDSANEIYARLMQFRHMNNLNPNKQYNDKDIDAMRENNNGDFNLLNRYDNKIMKKLLNDVASNKSKSKSIYSSNII